MKIDGKWVERNPGFNPVTVTPPAQSFARAEAVSPKKPEDFQREIIDFGFASVLKTDRFKTWIRASGILAYCRAKGWPTRCYAANGDDFECS